MGELKFRTESGAKVAISASEEGVTLYIDAANRSANGYAGVNLKWPEWEQLLERPRLVRAGL